MVLKLVKSEQVFDNYKNSILPIFESFSKMNMTF